MSESSIEAGHERRDASVRAILWVAAGMIVSAIVLHVGVGFYEHALSRIYPSSVKSTRITAPREEVPPPRLQSSPSEDWQSYRAASELHLRSYGWVDRKSERIHIPIERAMELTVQRGLPTRGEPGKESAP